MSRRPSLVASRVSVRYGGVAALTDVDVRIEPGAIVGLIGPNGAGKTSFINAVTAIVRPASGSIALGERRLDRLPQYRVARAGVARTYQNIRLFGALSVGDNLRAGAYRLPGALSDGESLTLLARAGLADVALSRRAASLSYGEQRRLEIARALASDPHMLLLDEPAAGMNPSETGELGFLVRDVAAAGAGVLLVEHDMALVSAVCHEVVVLNFGVVIARGTPGSIARDPAVIEAYLGTAETA
jgi:branched-chain amino acid transport system permease protein